MILRCPRITLTFISWYLKKKTLLHVFLYSLCTIFNIDLKLLRRNSRLSSTLFLPRKNWQFLPRSRRYLAYLHEHKRSCFPPLAFRTNAFIARYNSSFSPDIQTQLSYRPRTTRCNNGEPGSFLRVFVLALSWRVPFKSPRFPDILSFERKTKF